MAGNPVSVSLVQVTVHLDGTRGVKRFQVFEEDGFIQNGRAKTIGLVKINYTRSGTNDADGVRFLSELLKKLSAQYLTSTSISVKVDGNGHQLVPD